MAIIPMKLRRRATGGPALALGALLCSGLTCVAFAAEDPAPDAPAPEAAPAIAPAPLPASPPAAAPTAPPPPRGTSGFMGPRGPARNVPTPPAAAPASAARRVGAPYNGTRMTAKETQVLSAEWGIDRVHVASTNSGNLLKFTFRVVEPKRAKALGDHEAEPYIFAPRAHAVLHVPTMEQIGQLRQLHTDEVNKEYWIAFSNKGTLVKRGDRVDVIIGKFRAPGLLVE